MLASQGLNSPEWSDRTVEWKPACHWSVAISDEMRWQNSREEVEEPSCPCQAGTALTAKRSALDIDRRPIADNILFS
jgi:hypothetical protein